MYITKTSYEKSVNKRTLQTDIFSSVRGRFKHLVGLGGPNINDYLGLVKKAGIKTSQIYENNAGQLLIQASTFKPVISTQVIYGDIIQAETGLKNTLYDLDFCFSIKNAEEHIEKFRHDCTLITLALRPVDMETTIRKYIKALTGAKTYSCNFVRKTKAYSEYVIRVKSKLLRCYVYRDSSPMIVISNL